MRHVQNYFELKRGKIYKCNIDHPEFKGKYIYRLYKHYLQYRKEDGEWCYDTGKYRTGWSGVWNCKWYDDTRASYKEVERKP